LSTSTSIQPLGAVPSYKYLGIDINRETNWGKQWQSAQRKIASIPYHSNIWTFVKRYWCGAGLEQRTQPLHLQRPSCSAKEKMEMASFQRRALKIINVETSTAREI
jgi:hypothetical protein